MRNIVLSELVEKEFGNRPFIPLDEYYRFMRLNAYPDKTSRLLLKHLTSNGRITLIAFKGFCWRNKGGHAK